MNTLTKAFCSACILSGIASCSMDMKEKEVSSIVIGVENLKEEPDTKASIKMEPTAAFYWEDTDEVGIFPDKGGYQLGFSLKGQGGKKEGTFDGGGWALRLDTRYSTYYPFNFENRDPERIPISYLGQKQTGNSSLNHLGDYFFCATEPTLAENGQVSFLLRNIGGVIWFSITVPDSATYTEIALVTDNSLFSTEGYYSLKTLTPGNIVDRNFNAVVSTRKSSRMTLELENVTTSSENDIINAYMMAPPFDLTGHQMKLYVKTSDGMFYSADLPSEQYSHVFRRNASKRISATVKSSSGYNVGVDDWGSGEDIRGDAE